MRTSCWVPFAFALLGSIGCESTASAPPPQSAHEGAAVTKKRDEKIPPFRLGHFSSPDGFVAIVLDRTGELPKVQHDREKDVVELFVEEARDAGEVAGHWLNGPGGQHWFFLGTDGALWFIRPEARANATVRHLRSVATPLSRDAEADPLGAPTQRGSATPPPEKSAYEKAGEQLEALSVRARLPKFLPEESGNLAKIEEALGAIDASMLVRVSAKGAAAARWAPASEYIGNVQQGLGGRIDGYASDDPWDKAGKGLAKHGGQLRARVAFGEPSRLRTHLLTGWPPPLAEGTPGVVWMVSGGTVVFVSLDGGRYVISIPNDVAEQGLPVIPGAGALAQWPAPVQHALVDVDSIRGFAKGNAVPAQVGKDIEALDDAWFQCVNKAWGEGRKEGEKIEASPESYDRKRGKLSAIPKKYETKAQKDCAETKQKLEEGLVAFIEARTKARLSLHEKAKARAAALGVK
ncbi:hypothetical protein [Chondromyces crocatus]|uniref:Secreted protein n=1 Tax=Chondromyces crocatus TaxID=52 RepID=A0A0K1EBR5_CHOCO|nr:hypothetical protein [Chondromyces crocatus]AKT38294.1 uncharacterized protein CMC5_024390 [Chondromyces crocatus]